MAPSESSPNSKRWVILALGLLYFIVMILVMCFPLGKRDKAMITRPIGVRTQGFLKEDIAIGGEGINQSIAIAGNVVEHYKQGKFVSFPKAELTNPPYSSGGWRITDVYYSIETVFPFSRGDITLIKVDASYPPVVNEPIRLWDQNPTIEEE